MRQIDITPDKSLVSKLGLGGYTTEEALAELVDNSIDARLQGEPLDITITLNFKDKTIRIRDNGAGMDPAGLQNALTIAKETKDDASLGRFGIGMKSACSYLGKSFTIRTAPANAPTGCVAEYDEERWLRDESLDWKNFGVRTDVEMEFKRGTEITIGKVRVPMYPNQVTKFRERFGVRYGPYIKDGQVRVKVNTRPCQPAEISMVNGSRTDICIRLARDRNIVGWVGLLSKRSVKGHYGIHLYRRRRLVRAFAKFGIREHPSVAMLIGELALDHVPINFHKNGFLVDSAEYVEAEDAFKMNRAVADTLKKIPPTRGVTEQEVLSVLDPGDDAELAPLKMRLGSKAKTIFDEIGTEIVTKHFTVTVDRGASSDGGIYSVERNKGRTTIAINPDSRIFEQFKNPLFLLGLIQVEGELLAKSGDSRHMHFIRERNAGWLKFINARLPRARAPAGGAKRKRQANLRPNYSLSPNLIDLHDHIKDSFVGRFQFTSISTLEPYLHHGYRRLIYTIHTPEGSGVGLEDCITRYQNGPIPLLNPKAELMRVMAGADLKGDAIMIREVGNVTSDTWADPETAWLDLYSEILIHNLLPYEQELEHVLRRLHDQNLASHDGILRMARSRKIHGRVKPYLKAT